MTADEALSNESEMDIQVVGEEDGSVITYSPSLQTTLTHRCMNHCGYCSFQDNDNLVVPYSTIKETLFLAVFVCMSIV